MPLWAGLDRFAVAFGSVIPAAVSGWNPVRSPGGFPVDFFRHLPHFPGSSNPAWLAVRDNCNLGEKVPRPHLIKPVSPSSQYKGTRD